MKRRVRLSTVLLAASVGACAALGPVPDRVTPAERAGRAMTALQREAFALARYDLLALASDCRSGRHGREALLLLAAAELDTGNPNGSPRLARHLAAQYLLLPDASPERIPLARSLYRLGADLGGPPRPAEGRTAEPTPAPAVGDAHSAGGPASSSNGSAPSSNGPASSRDGPASSPDPTGSPLMPGLAPRFDTCEAGVETAASGPLPTTPAPRTVWLEALRVEMAAQADSLALLQAELTSSADSIAQLSAEIERIRSLLKSGLSRGAPRDHR